MDQRSVVETDAPAPVLRTTQLYLRAKLSLSRAHVKPIWRVLQKQRNTVLLQNSLCEK